MNFLAHLVLAEATTASRFGAMLGDFAKGIELNLYPIAVQAAVKRHRAIDGFTDQHPHRRHALRLFSDKRRRFAPVALDVFDDYLLGRFWSRCYPSLDFAPFCQTLYQSLAEAHYPTPPAMQHTLFHMRQHNWLYRYQQWDFLEQVLEAMIDRIRFRNSFSGISDELRQLEPQLTASFFQFYPELQQFVLAQGDEQQAFLHSRQP